MNLDNIQLEDKIGQRFIFGINKENIDVILELVKNVHLGGVILYKKNYKSIDDMINVINRLKEANKDNKIPLFISIDQEGGIVNRLPKEITNIKNIYEISKNKPEMIREYASIMAAVLSNVGVNMNFAPVVDIYNNSKSKALDKRCFYGDVNDITKYAGIYVDEFKKEQIISVIKHYPGHGATKIDSHLFMPYIYNYNEMLNKHMKPFDNLNDVVDAIMVGHIRIRKICSKLPASMNNKFLLEYLINNNGYDGLIISDEINMLKNKPLFRFIYLNKMFKSINDIILVKISSLEEGYKIINKYKDMVMNNEDMALELDEHVSKIVKVKKKYKVNGKLNYNKIDIDDINKRIDEINR